MISEQKPVKDYRRIRELSEKELNEITSAIGDRVRAQTIEQKGKIETSLLKAIDSTRTTFTNQVLRHDWSEGCVFTSPLNDLVEKSVSRNPIARFQNRAMSISYATQTGIKPPTFIFFASHARGIHFSYECYLMNQIRTEFGFDKVPIKLIFRKKR